MSQRITHSVLDPFILPLVPKVYRAMHIPRRLPPEAIVAAGHLVAIAGAVGFAFTTHTWWAGFIAAAGVAGNHLADMVDGTHARATGQCRNGGELLDHFTDPLSFAYWMIGLGVAADSLALALAAVIALFATAVLTSIKAKMTGRFTLARVGPTEFKALLTLYALTIAAVAFTRPDNAPAVSLITFAALTAALVIQLIINLITAIDEVNRDDTSKPDTTDWQLQR
jgi:phosphatidylglycerophosphate synthase